MNGTREAFGARGEWWVVGQIGVFLAWLAAPRLTPRWPWWLRVVAGLLGALIAAIGAVFAGNGVARLGRDLTPLPKPNDGARLRTDGIYGCVRHPIYGGVSMLAIGVGLMSGSLGRTLLGLGALVFFDQKARAEERWLRQAFPTEYPAYQAKVRRLLPGLW
ncbi:MAG: isoprenylcysteine carboxylmethyltransferase family protein [Dehalococcoidia bacterium]|nr:isoprenylcysteine carboxylmethyltransferase family protein [Dehalococcoidia bacterium]